MKRPIYKNHTRVCAHCKAEFNTDKPNRAKFCSLKCHYEYRHPWLVEAIRLYEFEELGCKRIGKRLGVHWSAVYAMLRVRGVLNPERQRAAADECRRTGELPMPAALGYRRPKMPKPEPNPNDLILAEYRFENNRLAKYDETRHWSRHSEAQKYRRGPNGFVKASRLQHARCQARKDNYWLSKKLRSRIYAVLRGIKKSAPTVALIGCSLEQFRKHIESQFKPGMTWANHGTHWHIDHIIACANYDLRKPEAQRECFHYSNQQPLLARENLIKSDSL